MVKRILVPVDESPQSADAVAFAASEWPDAGITLLHVIDPVEGGYSLDAVREGAEEWHKEQKLAARELLSDLRDEVDADVAIRIETGRPTRTVLDALDDGGFDHVVMGSHGRRGVSRVLLGSVAEGVVRESPVPVTIVRRPGADGSEDETA